MSRSLVGEHAATTLAEVKRRPGAAAVLRVERR